MSIFKLSLLKRISQLHGALTLRLCESLKATQILLFANINMHIKLSKNLKHKLPAGTVITAMRRLMLSTVFNSQNTFKI